MLHINDLTYRIAGKLLFEDASAHVPAGHRVGLVGRNGTGKTTLLRLIMGEIAPDGGRAAARPGASVAMLAQEAPGGSHSVLQEVLAADRERAALLTESGTAADPNRIAEIHTRLNDIGAHAAPARAASVLAGLGFTQDEQARPLETFSGGWRMRVALAAVLFQMPDLLVLDEPTNYLDLEATIWLEGFLKSYPHTLLLVSHDRDLLNAVPQAILHLDQRRLALHTGNYERFERMRRESLVHQASMYARQQAQRRHMQAFVDRFRYKATKARQAQSRIKALERMEPIAAVMEERTAPINLPNPEKELAPPLITLEEASVGYHDGAPVLSGLNLRIDGDDRIALLGANGNGKTTLARLLAGRLPLMEGTRTASGKLRVGYFSQHQLEELEPTQTAFQHLARLMAGMPEAKVRARIGQFGFSQDKADVPASNLSGGERSRLLLALMSHDAPHIMIFDEPTNHLDIDSRETLVRALNATTAAIVLISHDRHLLETCADRLWLVADGTVRPFEGDLEEYQTLALADRNGPGPTAGEARERRESKRDARKAAALARQKTASLRKASAAAEAELGRLTKEREALEAALADPDLYAGDSTRVGELTKRRAELDRTIRAAEDAWLAAQEALERSG